MGLGTWLQKQADAGRETRIAKLEREAEIAQLKAGKGLRRTGKHVKSGQRAQEKADRLRARH